ncbi:hypothetical protein DFJ58DRAFT_797603 [Suillus subalutaceus]|uniref:uncharacterized protein n=1 Tax=Suillus subalutaceus TaxID=48586 RepID=UPI001B86548B|nr:uncharacterized protein DFJ58DRAFT_797603 [Suillus subalutaceus]KAG1847516.1 hypothetical protein DFJ58DRAFT_797603 [Suillus subalutaceus]
MYSIPSVNVQGWILAFFNMAIVQGPLTIGFHCLELITNVIRNERQWRCATGGEGLRMTTNPLKLFFTDPRCLVLFFAKPLLHSMFGISLVLNFGGSRETISELWMYTCIAQIWNLCIVLIIFTYFFTFIAAPTTRPPASRIRTPPDTQQPRRRVVPCDVVGK